MARFEDKFRSNGSSKSNLDKTIGRQKEFDSLFKKKAESIPKRESTLEREPNSVFEQQNKKLLAKHVVKIKKDQFEPDSKPKSEVNTEVTNETIKGSEIYDVLLDLLDKGVDAVIDSLEDVSTASAEPKSDSPIKVKVPIKVTSTNKGKESLNVMGSNKTIKVPAKSKLSFELTPYHKARKRLIRALTKNIIMSFLLIYIVVYITIEIKGVTTEDLYMYGYAIADDEEREIYSYIANYNSTHEKSYIIPAKDTTNGKIVRLNLIIENVNYKDWFENSAAQFFSDYYAEMDEVSIYNLQLECYKLGDELAVDMFEHFGEDLYLSVYLGITPPTEYTDSVYGEPEINLSQSSLALSYNLAGGINREGNFPNNSPDLFLGTEVNNLPGYWGMN